MEIQPAAVPASPAAVPAALPPAAPFPATLLPAAPLPAAALPGRLRLALRLGVAVLLTAGLLGCGGDRRSAPGAATAGPPSPPPVLDLEVEPFDPPAAAGTLAPQLAPAMANGTWLSWIEPIGTGKEASIHRLRAARFDGTAWGEPVTVAEATPEHPFFANWADVPSVVEGEAGEMLAHWLAKTGDDTYAYGIFLARSTDGGGTWSELGTLHTDATPTEHGFVSLLPEAGGFRAFWLDGRAMAEGGAMALRTARIDGGVVLRDAAGGSSQRGVPPAGEPGSAAAEPAAAEGGSPTRPAAASRGGEPGAPAATAPAEDGRSEVLDGRVCECCQTSAARTAAGSIVVYRDRSEEEIRDIHAVRTLVDVEGRFAGWSEPVPVHDDGWSIAGCPVNGPAVAAEGERAVVAWFTAADDEPRVQAAFSDDGGARFGAPVLLDGRSEGAGSGPTAGARDDESAAAPSPAATPPAAQEGAAASAVPPAPAPPPLGRVDVALLADGTAVVSWLAGDGGVRLRRVSPDGTAGPVYRVAATSPERAGGFPRIALSGGARTLVVAWTDPAAEGGSRIRFAQLPVSALEAALPAPSDRR